MNNTIEKAGWKVHWKLTEASGVMVYLVDFKGHRVLWEGSLPYVTIDHQRQQLSVEEEEEAQASHGPFWVPLGTRTLVGDVRINELRGGFELAADFAAGPYRYTQLWRFHENGRMGPWLTIHGPGLHDAHTYHPHWRFDFDLNGSQNNAIERFEDGRWTRVVEEGWLPFMGEKDEEGDAWRQIDFVSGASISIRPHGREDAELFAIRYRDGDWTPISPRNDDDAQPFPAAYSGSDSLDGQDVMLWYVTHIHYDQSFPFTTGPWIRIHGL